jgi:hypothetical protein
MSVLSFSLMNWIALCWLQDGWVHTFSEESSAFQFNGCIMKVVEIITTKEKGGVLVFPSG